MIAWWNNINFAYPWALWGLLLIPLSVVALIFFGGRGRPVMRVSSLRFFSGLKKPTRVRLRPLLYALRLAALAVLILAFARPQSKLAWRKNHGNGIDIMMCMDVSTSMDAADFTPSRIEAAKKQAIHFVEQRPDDRVGMVVFSGEPYTLCPLTTDHEALANLVGQTVTGFLDDGTAIGMGLAKAVERLEDSKAKSRIVVLLTDGENNAGVISPEDAARLAKTYNIKVYIIGLGAAGDALQPMAMNPDGSYVMNYAPVNIDEQQLMEMAATTGGKYFRAADDLQLQEVYDEINNMEKTEFDKDEAQARQEEFLPLMFWIALFLGAEIVLRYTVFDSVT